MQMFEWAVSIGTAGRSPVGVTDVAARAQSRMPEALAGAPRGVPAGGWVALLAYGLDRLTYDRLDILAQVRRDEHGSIRWLEGADLGQLAGAGDGGQVPCRAGLPPRSARTPAPSSAPCPRTAAELRLARMRPGRKLRSAGR
jgi:hypothetical protein